MACDRILNVNEEEFNENLNYNNEDELLDKEENYLGNIVLRTRALLCNQLKRVTFSPNLIILNFKLIHIF
jgi:hypothetical protein